MKFALTLLAILSFLLPALAQTPNSIPTISQLFTFACNADFSSCPDGFDPTLQPVELDGALYGVTWWAGQNNPNAGGTVWKLAPGQVSVLHTFQPGANDQFLGGENPVIAFLLGADGNFYGVTESGGTANQGVMFKVTPSGSFQVLHNFCSLSNCADGGGRIILARDGNFYGVNSNTIFRLTPQGDYTVIHSLTTSEGSASTLIQGSDGNFYGTGISPKGMESGDIFQVTPGGDFTILHQFGDFTRLTSNLVEASDHNLYGGTSGAIFQLNHQRQVTFIHQLSQAEGPSPNQLLQASDGNLWGLSINGGTSPDRPGTVFALTLSGAFLGSEEFTCATTGCFPEGMVEGSDGNFYGNAIGGGTAVDGNPLGTVFEIKAGLPHPPR